MNRFLFVRWFALSIGLCCPLSALAQDSDSTESSKLPFRVSRETTYLTEPLTESGLVDYAAYLNREMSKGITPETNAAVLYWMANGKTWDETRIPDFQRKLVEALGTDPFADSGPYLVPFDRVYQEFKRLTNSDGDEIWDEYDRAMDQPWTADDAPLIKKWLDSNEQPLKLVIAGARRPHYYRPFVSTDDRFSLTEMLVVGWHFKQHRDMARMLKTRAMLALGENRPEDAIRDLLAIHRLARHSGQGGSMTDMLVGISMEGIACEGDKYLANSQAATAEQLSGYAKQLSQLPPLVDIERCYQTERFFSLDVVQKLATQLADERRRAGFMLYLAVSTSSKTVRNLVTLLLEHGLDWNQVLIGYNEYYDRIQAAVEQEQYAAQVTAINQLVAEHEKEFDNVNSPDSLTSAVSATSAERGEQMTAILLGLIGPAMEQSLEAAYRGQVKANLSQIGVALAACREQNGEFPEALDALIPTYLPKLPKDPYTGKPFVYRTDDEGAVIYGLGKNLKDDGGKTYSDDYENHDHVFRVRGN